MNFRLPRQPKCVLWDAKQREHLALQRNCAGRWLLAQSIEDVIFPAVCRELSWPKRSWKGKDGVAAHLAKLLPAPKYIRVEIDRGDTRKLLHYFIPQPQNVVPLQRP